MNNKKRRFEKYKHNGKINGGILEQIKMGQIKKKKAIDYLSTLNSLTVEDIRQWKEQLDKEKPPKNYLSEPKCVGDNVYFNGPDIYGCCSAKLWKEALLKNYNNK